METLAFAAPVIVIRPSPQVIKEALDAPAQPPPPLSFVLEFAGVIIAIYLVALLISKLWPKASRNRRD